MPVIQQGHLLDFRDVLIKPQPSSIASRSKVDLRRTINFKSRGIVWDGVPIIAANMDTIGTFDVYDILSEHGIVTAFHKFYSVEDYLIRYAYKPFDPRYFMISTGISDDDFEKLYSILNEIECHWICIDIANGYLSQLVAFCKKVREAFPNKIIVAGNVATAVGVENLIQEGGVDVVKIGIGPGSACTTRLKTGVGVPQLSAIMECAEAAHKLGGFVIGDGGITCAGDLAKAFAAGGDFTMIGGLFGGHDENPGEIIEDESNGKKYKMFYGMSSKTAMDKHYGGKASYRSSEGRCVKIPYRGPLSDTIEDLLGGVRSTCTYLGADKIEKMPKVAVFQLVHQQLNTMYVC